MTKWTFTHTAFPERRIKCELYRGWTTTEACTLLLERYMHEYHKYEHDEDIPLYGMCKNEDTGELYEITAKGSTFVVYEHQIDNLSLQITFPDPIDRSGDHPDQMQLEEVIS